MRKIYMTLFVFALANSLAFSQTKKNDEYTGKKNLEDPSFIYKKGNNPSNSREVAVTIFEDDFSDPSTWVIDRDPDAFVVDWQIGLNLESTGDAPIDAINSTTKENGYAMIDSDVANNTSSVEENSWLTMASPVDLTDFDKIVVEFETMYRSWTNETAFLVVSNDPNVWPDLTSSTNADDIVGVYKVFPAIAYGAQSNPVKNPTTVQINISDYAANQSQIWVRFSWNGIFGYSWYVDDFKIIEQPANDVKLLNSRFSHNGIIDINDPANFNLREEYARIPLSQISEFEVGAQSFNFGFETQTNILTDLEVLDANGTFIFGFSDSEAELLPNDTIFPTDEVPVILENGLYAVNFMVTSDEENDGDGENFENNTISRGLEVSTDYYALDGIGIHPDVEVGSITVGDDPTAVAEDEYRVMVHYDIKNEVEVFGIEVLLRSELTVPGGFIVASILDSTETLDENFDNPFAETEEFEVTQDDIDAGYMRMYFDEPITLENAPVFASVELFVSVGGTNDSPISILDDRTVIQPDLSSVIYVPDDATVFTNGNAAAIRLLLNGTVGINELKTDVAVLNQNVPNPASTLTRIDFKLLSNQNVTVIVTDILGKEISRENLGNLSIGTHQYKYNVSGLKNGIYQYTILTENGRLTKSMSVIK